MRLRYWVIGIVLVGWLAWRNSADKPLDLVIGTASDTFGILDRNTGHFVEIDRTGRVERELDLAVGKDARVVGSNRGTSLLWREGRRIALAPVDDLAGTQMFGKRVERLCAQTASTQTMFGAAWVERDGSIWILRGASYDVNDARELAATTEAKDDPSCAITNAEEDLVLLYRYGSRTEILRCENNQKCGRPRKLALPSRDTILGIGCARTFCMVATRSRSTTTLHWIDNQERITESRVISACKDGAVTFGSQPDVVAVGYSSGPEPIVEYSGGPGTLWPTFSGGDANTTPAVAWLRNVLLIASQRGGELQLKPIIFLIEPD